MTAANGILFERAEIIARHPAWRLNAKGHMCPAPWVTWSIAPIWIVATLSTIPTTPVLINMAGLGQYIDLARYASWVAGLFVAWVSLGLARQNTYPLVRFKPIFLGVFFAVLFGVCTLLAVQITVQRALPLFTSYAFANPMLVQTAAYKASRVKKCRRKCYIAPLTGRNKDRFEIQLLDYPNFISPLIMRTRPIGLSLEPAGPNRPSEPTNITLIGRGNWFGMQVDAISVQGISDEET